MRTTVKVEGLREFEAGLAELSKATQRNVLRRVLRKAGEPMSETARRLAPDDPATTAGDLKSKISVSTKVKTSARQAGKAAFASAIAAGASRADAVTAMRDAQRAAGGESFAEVYVGVEAGAGQGVLQEFGVQPHFQPKRNRMHPGHPPQPFLRPAWDQHKHQALGIIKEEMGGEIAKAAARARKRAARLAAKGA